MQFFINTHDLKIVYGKKGGPLLRFSVTLGYGNRDNAAYVVCIKGCLGRTYTEKDPDTGLTINTTKIFRWSPPILPGRHIANQVVITTPDIYQAVLKTLEEQGAIKEYVKIVSRYQVTEIPEAAVVLENVKEVGHFDASAE